MFPAISSLGAAAVMHAGATKPAPSARAEATAVTGHAMAVWQRFVAWRMRRSTRIVLCSLDDRILDDIGLERSEIDRVLRDLHIRTVQWRA